MVENGKTYFIIMHRELPGYFPKDSLSCRICGVGGAIRDNVPESVLNQGEDGLYRIISSRDPEFTKLVRQEYLQLREKNDYLTASLEIVRANISELEKLDLDCLKDVDV